MRVYLSGNISSNNYKRQFENAEMWLRLKGYSVINPVKVHDALCGDMTAEDLVGIDLALLGLCDTVFMLNGWQNDKRAELELLSARATGKEVKYQAYFERRKEKECEIND